MAIKVPFTRRNNYLQIRDLRSVCREAVAFPADFSLNLRKYLRNGVDGLVPQNQAAVVWFQIFVENHG
jgi:hypothetical protein